MPNNSPPHRGRGRGRRRRRGTTVVEFAIIGSVMVLMILSSIEFGRAMMSVHSLREAARAGCRVATLQGSTTADIDAAVGGVLNAANIAGYTVTIDPAVSGASRWDPITVTISVPFDNVTWLPVPVKLGGKTVTASATLPKEHAGT